MVEILERATDRLRFRMRNRFPQHHSGDSCLEFSRARAILQNPGSIEHCGFGSYRRMSAFLQLAIRIAQRSAGEPELGHVILDSALVFIWIGVNKIKSDVTPLKLLRDAAQLRRIRI